MTQLEAYEVKIVEQKAQRQGELATAEEVAPLVLGEQFASDLHEHIDDDLYAQAARVAQMYPGRYKRFCAMHGIEPDPFATMNKQQQAEVYRDMYPADYNDVA